MKFEKLINGGSQNKLREVCKNHEKLNVPPIYFEPESKLAQEVEPVLANQIVHVGQ